MEPMIEPEGTVKSKGGPKPEGWIPMQPEEGQPGKFIGAIVASAPGQPKAETSKQTHGYQFKNDEKVPVKVSF